MARTSKVWLRKGRGYWSVVRGHQRFLSNDIKAAKRKLAQLLLESDIEAAPSGRHSMQDLVVTYLRQVHGTISPRGYRNYRDYLETWLGDYRHLRPSELRAYHLREWLAKHPTWNGTTKRFAGSIVKIWSAWLEGEGLIDIDRLRTASLPSKESRQAADPQDLIKLERVIRDDAFRDFFVILYDTGARPGEVAGLTAEMIHFDTSTVLVHGKKGDRIIGLTPRALAILRRCALARPDGLLLLTQNGTQWTQQRQKDAFDKWQAVAKTNGHITPYHCRHDLYQRWTAAGIPELVIAKQLGHTLRGQPSLLMLNSVYAHVAAQPLAEAASRVDSAAQSSRPRRRG